MEMLAKNAAENLKGLNVSRRLSQAENDGNFINGFPSLKVKKLLHPHISQTSIHLKKLNYFQ